MPKGEKAAHSLIAELEALESNTEIIQIDLKDLAARRLIAEYVREHNKPDGEEIAKGSFNDFLKRHPDFQERCRDKVVVAEIVGGSGATFLGFDEEDQYSGINIDGGDFTGCRFKDVEIFEIRNVSLRDCVFEDVLIKGGNFSNVDLRGTRLDQCIFFNWSSAHSLHEIQLGFANPDVVQDKGVFTLRDKGAENLQIMHEEEPIRRAESREIKKYLKEQLTQRGWVDWALGRGADPELWGTYAWRDEDLLPEQREHILSIQEKYNLQREEVRLRAIQENPIRFSAPVLDPTYTPSQPPERANAIKVPLKATKADLEEYLTTRRKKSFNEFIADKHEAELNAASERSGQRMVIPVADISGEDLSGMDLSKLDLSGVNFAYCTMRDCVCTKTIFNGSCLEGSDLTGAHLEQAELVDCNMIGVTATDAHFEKAIMIRTQLNCSELERANFEGAIGYLACLVDSKMEHASLARADMRRSDLQRVNLRYVDARYADMRKANLSRAVADQANLAHADLSEATAQYFRAQKANLEEAIAQGADFSAADLREMEAAHADFEGAILARADAAFANFEGAILRDVQAQEVDFRGAFLHEVEAERIDISRAILDEADLRAARMREAVMTDISARKADFRRAFLEKADLRRAALVAADLRKADLSEADARGAALVAANLEGATVSRMRTDPSTILLDANLRDLRGDAETIEALRALQDEQHKLHAQWFGRSKYGHCERNEDGSNDRFKCQRLGAAVLSAALGGTAGVALAGSFAGIPIATLTTLISDRVLVATQEHYFGDLGYVNNALGDRLAEIGAVALSMGVGAADRAIDGAAAGFICSMTGAVKNIPLMAAGIGTALGGLKLSLAGFKEKSRWKKFTGVILTGAGSVASFFGFSSLRGSLNKIASGALIGGISAGLWAGISATKKLYAYDESAPQNGARPEHIYRESMTRAQGAWRKIAPTMKKFLIGITLAAVCVGLTIAAIKSLPLIGGFGIASFLITSNAAVITGTAGFLAGYLYDDKIIPPRKKISGTEKSTEMQIVPDSQRERETSPTRIQNTVVEPTLLAQHRETHLDSSAETVATSAKTLKQRKAKTRHQKKIATRFKKRTRFNRSRIKLIKKQSTKSFTKRHPKKQRPTGHDPQNPPEIEAR